MPRYLYIDALELNEVTENHCRIIQARSEGEAREFLSQSKANEALFLQFLANRTYDDGFAMEFYPQTPEEEDAFTQGGVVRLDRKKLSDRVHAFFAQHTDWARYYLSYFLGEHDLSAAEIAVRFPYEMRYFMCVHSNWLEEVQLINLDAVRVLG